MSHGQARDNTGSTFRGPNVPYSYNSGVWVGGSPMAHGTVIGSALHSAPAARLRTESEIATGKRDRTASTTRELANLPGRANIQ